MWQNACRPAVLVAALLGFGPLPVLAAAGGPDQIPPDAPEPLSPSGVRVAPGELIAPPDLELIAPAESAVLAREGFTLSWRPAPGLARGVRYTVRIRPLEPPAEGRGEPGLGTPVWEQTGLTALEVRYDGPPLDPERAYVWTVEALDSGGRPVAQNAGALAQSTGPLTPFEVCTLLVFPQPAKICQGQPATIGALLFTFSGGTTTYTLVDSQNQTVSSGSWPASNQIAVSPPGKTTYTLTLKRDSCEDSSTVTIDVAPAPSLGTATGSAAVSQSDPPVWSQSVNVCCGSGLKLQVGPPVTGDLQWLASGTPMPGATGASVNVNPGQLACNAATPTTVPYSVTASTDPVCPTVQSNPVSVTTWPPPQTGNLTVTKPILCADGVSTSQIGLTGSVGAVTWQKQPGCSGPWQPFSPPQLPFTVGPLQQKECYKVRVQSGPCPPVEQTVTIDVDPKPVAGTITAVLNPICPGDDSVLTLAGHKGMVQWYSSTNCTPPAVFGSSMQGATGNTVQNTNILQQTTCYGVKVSSPANVCPPVQGPILPVKVQGLPTAPVISGPQFLCPGKTVTLTGQSASQGQLQWYQNGDSFGPPGASTSLTVTEPGNYWLTVVGQCGSADSNVLTVKPDLLAVTIKGPCCACNGEKVKLCASALQGVGRVSFSWSTGASSSCIEVQPTATTSYTVTANDAAGCAVSSSFTVTVCP
jgi:hypothetical protein